MQFLGGAGPLFGFASLVLSTRVRVSILAKGWWIESRGWGVAGECVHAHEEDTELLFISFIDKLRRRIWWHHYR